MDTCHVIGDSFGEGYLVDSSERYSKLVCDQQGWIEDNHGVGGSQIYDQTDQVVGLTISNTDKALWITGINDVAANGTDANCRSDAKAALIFLAAWLAIPAANQLKADDPLITFGGSWTSDTLFSNPVKYIASEGATATFSITGTAIIIATARGDVTGSFTVTVDGEVVATVSCARLGQATVGGRSYGPSAIVISGLSEGVHDVVITSLSSSYIWFCWAAGISEPLGPKVYLGGTPLRVPGFYDQYPPYTFGSVEAADAYQADAQDVAAQLTAAGLFVKWRQIRTDTATTYNADGVHWLPIGHAEGAAQFNELISLPAPSDNDSTNFENRLHQLVSNISDFNTYVIEGNTYTTAPWTLINKWNREFRHSIVSISGVSTTGNYITNTGV